MFTRIEPSLHKVEAKSRHCLRPKPDIWSLPRCNLLEKYLNIGLQAAMKQDCKELDHCPIP